MLNQAIKSVFKFILIITFYLIFASIIMGIYELFNIDIADYALIEKIIVLLSIDILFLSLLVMLYYKDIIKDFKKFKWSSVVDNGKYYFLGLLIMSSSNVLISLFTPSEIAGNEEAIQNLIKIVPFYMLFSSAIYAPLTEELIFRKELSNVFKRKWLYIIMSGFIFGGLHVISNIEAWYSILYIIPYGALGSVFAYIYYKEKNILIPIVMHGLHNGILVLISIIALLA